MVQQNNSRSIFFIQIHGTLHQTVEELGIRDQKVNKFVCILPIPQQEKKDIIFVSLDVLFHVYFSTKVSW